MKRSLLIPVILFLVAPVGFGQTRPAVPPELANGLSAFENGDLERAVTLFDEAIAAPGSAYDGHALYWKGRTYLALGRLQDAANTFDEFVNTYSEHPYLEESQYQRARVFYLDNQYEAAIQSLARFLERYPESEFSANALFWTAESLLALGRLDEAERLFREVTVSYPTSFRFEAAQYRLEILELKRRENELLTLLQWSHEEYLQALELQDQREREYREALRTYRSRIAGGGSAEIEATISDLNAEIARLERRVADQQQEINTLLARLRQAGVETDPSTIPNDQAQPSAGDVELREALRQLRDQALELQEALLEQESEDE
ncbi:MAG: tetratricopeptide repeat protein [Spirochaetales bacterium]